MTPASQAPDTSPVPAGGGSGTEVERVGYKLVPVELTEWMIGEGMRAHMGVLYTGKKSVNEGIDDGVRAVRAMWPALLAAAIAHPASDREARLVAKLLDVRSMIESAFAGTLSAPQVLDVIDDIARALLVEMGEKL